MSNYQVTKIKNVVETSNLESPDWYDEKKGGYTYRWTNLTHLKLNESNGSNLKQVYYYGLGPKGKLGYVDGSYYDSCKSLNYKEDKSNPKMEWKFEVDKFFIDYETAEYHESFYLQKEKATQSTLYYNGNNGFIKIIEGKVDEVSKLKKDIDDATKYFMSKDIKEREGFYNGFEYRIFSMDDVENFIPYQLPEREEDEEVIDDVCNEVLLGHGDASNIPPILIMDLKTGILKDDEGNFLEGILNPAGNHRKKGCKEGGATRMGVLIIPEFRITDFGAVEIKQLAMADNPSPKAKRNPTGDDEYVDVIRDMVKDKGIPVNHADVDNFLILCNVKPKKRTKLKKLAEEARKHQQQNTTPIKWNSKGWSKQAKKIEDKFKDDNTDVCVASVEAFNIEKIIDARTKWANDKKVLNKFVYIMHGKSNFVWDMWKYEAKGKRRAKHLIEGTKRDNIEGNEFKVIFKELPSKHASIGVNDKNFWKSQIGKDWLNDEEIELGDK